MKTSCRRDGWAFTLIELLVVVAIIAILASLILPALSHAKEEGRKARCMGNVKQMQAMATMYATDNDDQLVRPSQTGGGGWNLQNGTNYVLNGTDPTEPGWVCGVLDFSRGNQFNTNTAMLVQTRWALFAAYNRNAALYKCPSDPSVITYLNGKRVPRVRSYSLNRTLGIDDLFINGKTFGELPMISDGVIVSGPMRKVSDVKGPPPAQQFAFLDENPNSIMGGDFFVDGFARTAFDSLPASYHNQAGVMGYVDGHVIVRRWRDPRTRVPLNPVWVGFDAPASFWGVITHSADAIWFHSQTAIPTVQW